MSFVWLDPDEPAALFDRHRLWSTTHPAPVRFKRSDYFDGGDGPIGPALRALVEPQLGRSPRGPIRMLTQPRTWGWLFNPITIYLLWCDAGGATTDPAAAVLEVTNTPWKERHHYAVALSEDGGPLTASFDKALHVSPFLDEDLRYHLRVAEATTDRSRRLTIDLDVVDHRTAARGGTVATGDGHRIHGGVPGGEPYEELPPPSPEHDRAAIDEPHPPTDADAPTQGSRVDADAPADARVDAGAAVDPQGAVAVVTTRLVLDRRPADPRALTRALLRNPFPTHRVSLGIHAQAARLWRKRVPFVPHPARRSASEHRRAGSR